MKFAKLPATFEARGPQGCRETLAAASQEEAEELARDWLREGSWDTENHPVFADADIMYNGEVVSTVEVAIPQDEPKCAKRYPGGDEPPVQEHAWVDRGVFGGQAGGVNSRSECEHCGCIRTHHSRYQRHDTGATVRDVVTYDRSE